MPPWGEGWARLCTWHLLLEDDATLFLHQQAVFVRKIRSNQMDAGTPLASLQVAGRQMEAT